MLRLFRPPSYLGASSDTHQQKNLPYTKSEMADFWFHRHMSDHFLFPLSSIHLFLREVISLPASCLCSWSEHTPPPSIQELCKSSKTWPPALFLLCLSPIRTFTLILDWFFTWSSSSPQTTGDFPATPSKCIYPPPLHVSLQPFSLYYRPVSRSLSLRLASLFFITTRNPPFLFFNVQIALILSLTNIEPWPVSDSFPFCFLFLTWECQGSEDTVTSETHLSMGKIYAPAGALTPIKVSSPTLDCFVFSSD